MSNIENRDISLKDIVKNISKDSYLIPKFQRDFVWITKDIVALGDSIIRGYPISSLLIMPENGTLKVGAHSLFDEGLINKNIEDNESKHYILDGQQRITSISRLFLAIDNKWEYYFDLLAILVEKYRDDNIQNDSGLNLDRSGSSKIRESNFCREFGIGKDKSEHPTKQNNRFISGKKIIQGQFNEVISSFLFRTLKDANDEDIAKYNNYLGVILGDVGGYKIPTTVIAGDSELGVVIRVFEKVNSTGKKLTLFDLINAKSFQVKNTSYKDGLSNYLTNKILSIIINNNDLKSGVNIFLNYDEDKESFEKLGKIIRIFEITSLLEKGSAPSIFQNNMLSKEPEFWFENWNNKGQRLLEIISWMDDERLFDIGQVTFLEYAIAVFLANPKSFDAVRFKTEIKKYALYLSLSGSTFSKSNLGIVDTLYSISKKITDNHESTKYDYASPSSNPNLTYEKILGFTTSKSEFKAIINIFYNDKPDGKFTTDIVGNKIKEVDKGKMDNHHIYPKSRVNPFSNKSKFNSIANIVLIDSISNRIDIKDKLPKDYFKLIISEEKGVFFCKQNLIDIDEVMKIDSEISAKEFIDNRAKKIAAIINSYFI